MDENRGPRDVPAAVTGQKCDHAGDLGRLRHPAERDGGVRTFIAAGSFMVAVLIGVATTPVRR